MIYLKKLDKYIKNKKYKKLEIRNYHLKKYYLNSI